MAKKGIIALIIAFLVLQFFQIDKLNPALDPAQDFLNLDNNVDVKISRILKDACYDCHSNATKYPWYTNIAPVNFWIKNHIDAGREHLNFSTWSTLSQTDIQHKLEECIEEIEAHKMPLSSYTWLHASAKLDDQKMKDLINYFEERKRDKAY